MSDKLEQYIRNHREELDLEVPDADRLWTGIEAQLPAAPVAKVKRPTWREPLLRWAASLLVAVSIGTGWNLVQSPGPIGPMDESAEVTASGLPSEFANMEAYYRDEIEQHRSELVAYHEEGISLDDRFSVDLDQLQTDYRALQQELQLSENSEAVIDAMVQNLTMQLNIVQQQLRILETIKKAQQTTNEAVHI
ncbi:MAG: hypothetical protein AB8F95_03320 [Bacteroidia bacterium]